MSKRNQREGAFVLIVGHKCYRCSHTWRPTSLTEKPKVCPKCKSPYWDKPRQQGKGKN